MANFINYIIESSVQPTKTNVLWIKNGVPYYFNKKWKPLLGVGSGGGGSSEEIKSPIIFGEGKNSAILQYTNSNALGENSVSLGSNTTTNNIGEAAFGMYNKSILSTDPSKASLFSIGNGTSNVLKNAFEIKYNGDVYIENIDTSIQEYLKQLTLADSKLSSDLNLIINTTISNLRSEIRQIETGLNGKIETNTSLITQTAFEITQEVSNLEVKYDGEFANTKESISKISQKADTIELEVEEVKTTTNGLSTRIEENTASIELNKRNITSKVSRSEFNSATEEINKQYTEVVQTVDSITQTVKAQDGRLTQVETTVDGLTVKTGTLEADIESLKKQSDGSIDTHFGTVAPTLDNEPAVNWVTDEEKIDHIGDIYYNNNTGEAYRFSYDPTSNTYFWVELTDSALTDALSKISKLEEAIDGKVTIFYTEPTNYKYGDLWFVHKDYNSYKEGSIVTSTNIGKDVFKESFTESDWEVKTNYTTIDDLEDKATEINDYIEGAFKDNVLTEAELSNIKELKASFELAQAELEESYNILYISSVATQENKNLLSGAFNALKTAYNALIDALDNLTAGTVDEYRTAYSEYLEALKNYSKIASEFTESIQSELLKANQYISDIASDNIVTPIEKKQLFEIWRQILEEFETNKGIAINYKIIDSEGNQRTDIYTSNDYYLVYKFYRDAHINLIVKFDVFDLDNLNVTTTLPNGYSISAINAALDIYYSALKEFSKLISKITIEITDAHDKALALANSWQEHLDPKDAISVIGKGVILSTVIGVQSEGVLEAVLNASDDLPQAIDSIHGKIIFAGGIGGSENWNDATTLIYEDGYVHFKYGKIDESVQLGSAFLKAVSQSSEIDVLSYPQNGVNVPLLQINKDNTGKIISISSLYDFYVNGNLVAYGDVATSGAGQDTPGSGGSVIGGIMVNGMPYTDDDGDGFITLPDYPKKLSALENDLNLGSFAYKNALAVSDIPDLSGKYLPLSGGRIEGNGANFFIIDRTDGNPLIRFDNNAQFLGRIGFTTDYKPIVHLIDGNIYEILTSAGGTIEGDLKVNGYLTTDKTRIRLGSYYIFVSSDVWKVSDSNWQNDYTLLHSGNYSDYALPLTGGTITSAAQVPLMINSSNASLNAIVFGNNAGDALSYVGYSATYGTRLYDYGSSSWLSIKDGVPSFNGKTLLHSGNYSDYALPLTGGTIGDGKSDIPLSVNGIGTNVAIALQANGVAKGYVNWNQTWGTHFIDGVNTNYRLGIKPDGTPYYSNSASSSYTILTSAGGTITGTTSIPLYIKSSHATEAAIGFSANNAKGYGYLIYKGGDVWNVTKEQWAAEYTLLHSGNVGEYNAGGISRTELVVNNDISILNNFLGKSIQYAFATGLNDIVGRTDGLILNIPHSETYGQQWFLEENSHLIKIRYNNGGNWSSWKTIAFTDSDITGNAASAGKLTLDNGQDLVYKNTDNGHLYVGDNNYASGETYILGNSIKLRYGASASYGFILNSSGNVTIGASDLAGTSAKLYVDGGIRFAPRTIWGQSFDGTGNVNGAIRYTNGLSFIDPSDNNVIFGYDYAQNNKSIYIDGAELYFRYSSAHRIGLILNSSGNVGIGTINPAYKLDVAGTGRFTGKTTHDGGIDIPNGQQLAFLDASGNRHTIAWDSASNGILIDGNLIVLGELATGLPMQEIPSIPEIGV